MDPRRVQSACPEPQSGERSGALICKRVSSCEWCVRANGPWTPKHPEAVSSLRAHHSQPTTHHPLPSHLDPHHASLESPLARRVELLGGECPLDRAHRV